MARIRTVKPEFWIDERIGECSPTARLLFIATWNFADDNGNLERSARQLKAQAFPYDSFDLEPLLVDLISKGLLEEYEVSGHKYLHISNFEKHQKIEKKSLARHPLPNSYPTTTRPVGIVREGKGRDEEEEVPRDSDKIVFEIAKAYPECTYDNEMQMPPVETDAIIYAINQEKGQSWKVLEGVKRYAESITDSTRVMGMEKFFKKLQHRREWRNGDATKSTFGGIGALLQADAENAFKLADK
jgi:hypothetical protein